MFRFTIRDVLWAVEDNADGADRLMGAQNGTRDVSAFGYDEGLNH